MAIATTKMRLPAGMTKLHIDGVALAPDASGFVLVPSTQVAAAEAAGCYFPHDIGTTALRPTGNLSPGQFYFDATLNRPIWRNASNTGWVFSDGTAA